MQIILSHVNTDFDALASMVAAKKLYPEAEILVSNKQTGLVKQFLNIYRDSFHFLQESYIDWEEVSELILVDVASLRRVGNFHNKIDPDKVKITIYDHHPFQENNLVSDAGKVEEIGATATILVEKIRDRDLSMTAFEATLFGLGIYTDTGFFTYDNTTARDLAAASFLLEKGMNLEMIQRFTDESLQADQEDLLDHLYINSETIEIDGLKILVSSYEQDRFLGGLAIIAEKLLEIKTCDAVLLVVGMNKHTFVVGRASSDRISLLPLLKIWQGGGHRQAGSAMVKNSERQAIHKEVLTNLSLIVEPARTAAEIMTSPVRTISPDTTIEEAGQLMYRYKHSGYPVVEDDILKGIITRRDLDKAKHHGLGHAPVKAYMTTKIITISQTTPLEEIQQIVIDNNIGRLPVVKNGHLLGIISRTDIISAIHEKIKPKDKSGKKQLSTNIKNKMREELDENIYLLLKDIGQEAERKQIQAFLIGGIVRDIFLKRPNDDIDIVIEGNGIKFAQHLADHFGGEVLIHENFGTASWTTSNKIEIDFASARLEFYERPGSLPDVELSTLKEDLSRRDFTINAMAVSLNKQEFGELVDPFSGQRDLQEEALKVLHNLSFVEDPTRILRAIRFELRFDFKMDEQTEQLALNSIDKMTSLSPERIINELKRLYEDYKPEDVTKRLFQVQFWQKFKVSPDCENKSCELTKKLEEVRLAAQSQNLINEDFSWFQYFALPFYDKKTISSLESFSLRKNDQRFSAEIKELLELEVNFKNLGEMHRSLKDFSSQAILFYTTTLQTDQTAMIFDYLVKRQNLPSLVTGTDLRELGLKPGPKFKEIFFELDIALLKDEISDKKAALDWVKDFIKK